MEEHQQNNGPHDVRIHIDERPYFSPSPTRHDDLYALAHVGEGLELFREVTGDHEDQPVPRGTQLIELEKDDHFHSGHPVGHEIKIFVNTREFIEKRRRLTYVQVVELAYPNPDFETHTYKVTYFRHDTKHEGTLAMGQSVRLSNEMEFTVVRAYRS